MVLQEHGRRSDFTFVLRTFWTPPYRRLTSATTVEGDAWRRDDAPAATLRPQYEAALQVDFFEFQLDLTRNSSREDLDLHEGPSREATACVRRYFSAGQVCL